MVSRLYHVVPPFHLTARFAISFLNSDFNKNGFHVVLENGGKKMWCVGVGANHDVMGWKPRMSNEFVANHWVMSKAFANRNGKGEALVM